MSKPMTHLEAFCSPDAINGRVWTDGCSNYKRHYNHLWIDAHKDGAWKFYDEQVAAMSDDVVWAANEPKTLTPQEALRALADGGRPFREIGGNPEYYEAAFPSRYHCNCCEIETSADKMMWLKRKDGSGHWASFYDIDSGKYELMPEGGE